MQNYKSLLFLKAIILMLCTTVTAQKWAPVGNVNFTPGTTANTSLAIDTNGTPFLAFLDATAAAKATVMKYDGSNWVVVGAAGFTAGSAYYNSLAFDNDGVLYLAYANNGGKATVMKYDGTSWATVGGAISAGQAMYVSLAIDNNNIPYVAYRDYSVGQKVTVMKFNGTSWVSVGNVGLSAAGGHYVSLGIDNNVPYVIYRDDDNNFKATVMKFDGTNWVAVGGVGLSAGSAEYTTLAFDNNHTPYISYQDLSISQKAVVRKFNGSNWVDVGNPGFSPGFADDMILAMDNTGVPYVAFRDAVNGFKTTVMKFDDTSWVLVGMAGFNVSNPIFPSFALDKNNKPYFAFVDFLGTNKATVMSFGCPGPEKISICAALTDTVTGSNKIVWNGSAVSYIDSYKVYRHDGSSYMHIASVAGNVNVFTDPTANPTMQSYKYKLTLLDSCGREMDIDSSTIHRTMKLELDYMSSTTAVISWNKYEGISNPVYTVRRSTNGGAFTTIDSFAMSGDDTTYIDNTVSLGTHSYRVDIPLANPCVAGADAYNKITSNTITSSNVGVGKRAGNNQILLAPNPANQELHVSAAETINTIEIFSVTGQKLIAENGNGKKGVMVDVGTLLPGVYVLKVNRIYHTSFIKQ